MKKFKYDEQGRMCNHCDTYKEWSNFTSAGNLDMPYGKRSHCKLCISLKRKTREQRERRYEKRKQLKTKKIQEAIKLVGGNIDINNGFIYLYRCEELDCFKIGRTKDNPFDYAKPKSMDYGLDLKMVAYIVSPVRDCDAEWLATKSLKHKKVKHKKPRGGYTHELFRCGLYEALNILRSISNKMYIEPNPYVTLEDLKAEDISLYIPTKRERHHNSDKFNKTVANRILRGIRNDRRWTVDCGDYISACVCRIPANERGVYINKKTGASYIRMQKKDIYLGRHGLDKGLIIEKFKSVYDLRDSLFVNGRYAEGSIDAIREEVKRVRYTLRS